MSELSEAINEMRNMRESYDQLGAAAEAYNTGKVQLAQNITSKGVEASATETLPELAEKVAAISQETYEINGGEMYAKQLFGSLETPNYWNLYEVLANLLSDGRLVQYGGILLAEYYRGYDSLALSGAGAGGAYVVSDKDENGQFKMYTEDTTHTWATEFDGHGNRWVAYCFVDEYHDFQITNTSTSPRSIFIGRKVGTITSLINGRVSQIVVPDGNTLSSFNTQNYTQNFTNRLVLKTIGSISGRTQKIAHNNATVESLYFEGNTIYDTAFLTSCANLSSAIINVVNSIDVNTAGFMGGLGSLKFMMVRCPYIRGLVGGSSGRGTYVFQTEDASIMESSAFAKDIILKYITNDRTKSVSFSIYGSITQPDFLELQDGWCKPLNISIFNALTEENIVNHILNKLGDNTGQSPLTITLGATNLAKLTAEEKAIATNKGFILA